MRLDINNTVKKAKKCTTWRYGKPGGREEYYRLTDELFQEVTRLIGETEDIDELLARVEELITEAKNSAYGKLSITASKKERIEDKEVWAERVRLLAEHIKGVEGERLSDQIYQTVKKIDKEGRVNQIRSVVDGDTGKTLQTRDEIFGNVLKYNVNVLEKRQAPDNVAEVVEEKLRVVSEILEGEEDRIPFSLDEFHTVVEKLTVDKKAVYNDFLWAGPKFKLAVFLLLQRIYLREEVPASFRETMLMPLYKGKGDRKELSSHRFLHLKKWMAKVFEKMLMQRVEAKVRQATPDLQQGGQPGGSTMDHLVSMVALINVRRRKNSATVITLMDIVKCFDKCKLGDILYEFANAGVGPHDLRLIRDFNENTKIRIQGDCDPDRAAVVQDSVGQGTTGAVSGAVLMMGRKVEKVFKESQQALKVGDVTVMPTGFVDDVASARGSLEGAHEAGRLLTEVIDELSLSAHPEKTVNIVVGGKAAREKLARELDENPPEIQGFRVRRVKSDVYLGMTFDEGGVKESISRSIEARRAKAIKKAKQAKMILKDLRVHSVGWLDAARALYQGTIVPTLTYSSIAWVRMNKTQREQLEKVQKDCIYELLGLHESATYAAVLLEFGLPRIQHFVNQLKIRYVTKLVENKPSSMTVRLLREEESQFPGTGLLGEVKEICAQYGLPDATETYLGHEEVKRTVSELGMREVWNETRRVKKVPLRLDYMKARREYFSQPKIEARAAFLFYVGELNFRTSRRKESEAKFGSVKCLARNCHAEDTWRHVRTCRGYSTRVPSGEIPQEQMGKIIVALNDERVQKWNSPLYNVM